MGGLAKFDSKMHQILFCFSPLTPESPLETASSADREENKEKAEKMSAKQRDLLALSRQGSCVKWMLSN